jgi:hypothetical protein
MLKIDLEFLMRKTGARLNFKIVLLSLHFNLGDEAGPEFEQVNQSIGYPWTLVNMGY